MGKNVQAIDLSNAIRVMTWNRRILNIIGIWPLEVYDVLFVPSFVYMVLHCSLTIADLFETPKSVDDVMANISENALFLMTLGKITYCRVNRRSIAKLLEEVEKDIVVEKYERLEEKLILWSYNKLSFRYILMALPTLVISLFLYYAKTMVTNIDLARENGSMDFHLPYKTRVFFDIHDPRIYFSIATIQMTIIIVVGFGYAGMDCLCTSLALHVAAQFAILRCRIKDTMQNTHNFPYNIKKLVIKHYKAIRLAESLEDEFNIIILQQLLGTMIHICFSVYNWVVSEGNTAGRNIQLTCFILYGFYTIATLFLYCYMGECLIQESVNFGESFYLYEWYNLPPTHQKLIYICMLRAGKPLQLTSGKFVVLSLCTFTDTVKAAVGYFSVLRHFL